MALTKPKDESRPRAQDKPRREDESRYGIGEAKAHLSEIVDHIETTGEAVLLTRHGKPVARIVPERTRGPRKLGASKGRIKLLPGWDEPLTFEDMFSGE